MKKNLLTIILVAVLSAASYYLIHTETLDSRATRYLSLQQEFVGKGESMPNGPDKANLRDFMMTVDLDLGVVPKQRTLDFVKSSNRLRARKAQENKFQWSQSSSDVAGRSRAFLLLPSGKLLSGAITGGLWMNEDYRNDAEWKHIESFEHISVSCLAYDPQDEDIIYLGTGESYTAFTNYRESSSIGSGIYKSTDGGATWSLLSSSKDFSYVNDIVVRTEEGTSVVYAGIASGSYQQKAILSSPSDGLYKSTDGGANWTQELPNIPDSELPFAVSDIEVAANNDLYVGTMRNIENEGGGYLLKLNESGSWDVIGSIEEEVSNYSNPDQQWYAGRVKLETAPSDPNVVYAVYCLGFYNVLNQLRDYATILKKSNDAGQNWVELFNPGFASLPWHALALAVDPNNPHKLLTGGLDVYVINDTQGEIYNLDWIRISDWQGMYAYNIFNIPQAQKDSLKQFYVHADVHDIQYIGGSSDEVLIATDGGLFSSFDMSLTDQITGETSSAQYPTFNNPNKGLTTTQYYTVALHPEEGRYEALAGTQDNGTIRTQQGKSDLTSMVSGGDGAYVFYDEDNPSLYITSVYANRYYVHIGNTTHFINAASGLFVNPADYDSRSNRLYANMAQSSYGGLLEGLAERYYDTLLMIDVNTVLSNPDNPNSYISTIPLKAGITQPFTGLKLSPHASANNAELIAGTVLGQVYRITGLPDSPVVERIDNDQIPVGYISSVDIGWNDQTILVTISNYGVESVWYTNDGGENWQDLERNLPDIPVRYGLFNPYDDHKILLATEVGGWGLEDLTNSEMDWIQYDGMPMIRVDMLDIRKSDSVVAAATHGSGLYFGKLDQGKTDREPEVLGTDDNKELNLNVYPNPVENNLTLLGVDIPGEIDYKLVGMNGAVLEENKTVSGSIDMTTYSKGIYLLHLSVDGQTVVKKVIKK